MLVPNLKMTLCEIEKIDLGDIPVFALRPETVNKICSMMNMKLVIPSPSGLPRNWQGLAQLLGLKPPDTQDSNPTAHILQLYGKQKNASVKRLQELFGELDRWDVFDDTEQMIIADRKHYLEIDKNPIRDITNSGASISMDEVVTFDDLCRAQLNLPPQMYDAFVLFAEEDQDFAMMTINKLEKEFMAKVCFKDRDFVVGLPFEHVSVMKMLKERCHRFIFIISNSFIRSKFNEHLLNFASVLSLEQQKVKFVPIVLEHCPELPVIVQFCHLLDYTRQSTLMYFWEKLRLSVVNGAQPNAGARSMLDKPKEKLSIENAITEKESISEESSSETQSELQKPIQADKNCDNFTTSKDTNLTSQIKKFHSFLKRKTGKKSKGVKLPA